MIRYTDIWLNAHTHTLTYIKHWKYAIVLPYAKTPAVNFVKHTSFVASNLPTFEELPAWSFQANGMAVSLFERLAMERDPQFLAIQYRAWAWRGKKKGGGRFALRDVA